MRSDFPPFLAVCEFTSSYICPDVLKDSERPPAVCLPYGEAYPCVGALREQGEEDQLDNQERGSVATERCRWTPSRASSSLCINIHSLTPPSPTVLVSDGWPTAADVTLLDPLAARDGNSTATATANVLQTNDLSLLAAVAWRHFNTSVLFGGLPDNHAGPTGGVFDRSHPKVSGLNGLYPRWKANLNAFIAPALPLLRNGTLQGIFVGDEIYCSNIAFSNYSAVLTELRRLVGPHAVIWANECGHPSGWPIAMWPKAPPELDWLSIDQYDVLHGAEEVTMAQKYWSMDAVKSKLWPHQRLLAVPGTFACDQSRYQTIAEAQIQVCFATAVVWEPISH